MSSLPVIAAKKSIWVELEAGKDYWWCRCGLSKNQPFCDGAHQGSDIEPMCFSVDKSQKYSLCCCKHSQDSPFCDGAHKAL